MILNVPLIFGGIIAAEECDLKGYFLWKCGDWSSALIRKTCTGDAGTQYLFGDAGTQLDCTPSMRHGNQGQISMMAIAAGGIPGRNRGKFCSYSCGDR